MASIAIGWCIEGGGSFYTAQHRRRTGADDDDAIASAIRNGAQDTIGDAGCEIVRLQIDVPPTLKIRPGFPVRVIVTRDLILEPQGER